MESQFGLRQIELDPEYNTEDHYIISSLYSPCLKVSTNYDRAVGYFRANIYRELGEDLLNFVIAGGKVRIVCSPDIPELDEIAAREGYARRGKNSFEEQEITLMNALEVMAKSPKESDCLDMLRLLIEHGSLDLFIAMRKGGIYHRKIGIFSDAYGNKVVFSGSGNETRMAISGIEDWGNDEEFDVYRSWGDNFESSKAKKKAKYLQMLFEGGTRNTKVRPLNEIELNYLSRFRSYSNFEDCRLGAKMRSIPHKSNSNKLSLFYYQKQAIASWESANRVGMLSMATGTGKTITALFAIKPLVEAGKPILILVPSKILLDQWYRAIRDFYPSVPIYRVGGGHNWKDEPKKRMFVSTVPLPRIILSTMSSASTHDFIQFFNQAKNPVLIADEAHRLGSPMNRRILKLEFKERLGLSATPERLYDPEGDEALASAFGLHPVYTLPLGGKVKLSENDQKEVPILGSFLSNYVYDFQTVSLSNEEQKDWDELTNKISRAMAIDSSKNKKPSIKISPVLQQLLIKRARIIKHAIGKIEIAGRIITERYPCDGRWIVYCEDETQMNNVACEIRRQNKYIPLLMYHSKMSSEERDSTLKYIERNPCVVVSIRCLDEGVDIPAIDGALILASSKNPREYIQRRGRVLRKAEGKKNATIIDILVLPKVVVDPDDDSTIPIVRGEIARAWEFAELARNQDISHRLWKLCQEYGVSIESDAEMGLAEDEEMED